jgi:DNA-binding transcriptional ArsR family regulator
MEQQSAIESFVALAHESRLAIFRLLVPEGSDGLTAGKIGERLGIPANALSFHLTRLRYAGLVTVRRNGRQMIYAAAYDGMQELIGFMTEHCCRNDPRGCSSDCPQPLSSQTNEKQDRRKTRTPPRPISRLDA